ncbi:MAG TPA: phosphoribosylanthranilate isomerase [Hyphomicrobiales bacterium]|nr:phosphoribosylanthranilate isomerase [Hyphomicrobiales bacterium]
MSVAVKICGLSRPDTLEAALVAGATYIGLVFYEPSPRNVSLEQAEELAALARGRATIVALTVDASDALLHDIAERVRPDFLQAHGEETPERVREITEITGIPGIKAIKVKNSTDVDQARAYADVAAMVLFDAGAPDALADALPGGNGIAFDWSLLESSDGSRQFMLSGGLNCSNIAEAIRVTGAPVVDVSSGVERAPGIKDAGLIRKFIEAARSAR